MAKISDREKIIITFLVCNCEIYKLNEKEALQYIHFNLLQPVSRRTYYHYKKEIYDICLSVYESDSNKEEEDENFQFFKLLKANDFIQKEQLRMLLFDLKKILIKEGLKTGFELDILNEMLFTPEYFIDSGNRFKSILNNHRNALDKIKQELYSNNINRKSIPSNVTIREEYIKCGKAGCNKCRHGPYYYGYWREKGKLKKKYIGINK
jgi:hypothetical protein